VKAAYPPKPMTPIKPPMPMAPPSYAGKSTPKEEDGGESPFVITTDAKKTRWVAQKAKIPPQPKLGNSSPFFESKP